MRVYIKYVFRFVFYFYIYNVISCVKTSYNTYRTESTRATPFYPNVAAKTCLLEPDPGPCRGNIPMYYFKPSIMNCTKFSWGGCQGNGNRFDYKQDCMETCLTQPNRKKARPRWCSLSFDYGFCFGAIDRWYYDKIWKVCKKTIYSGCGGNRNNFYNKEQCDAVCRLGIGMLPRKTTASDGVKKILIINPWDTTPKRGKHQTKRVHIWNDTWSKFKDHKEPIISDTTLKYRKKLNEGMLKFTNTDLYNVTVEG